MKELYKQIIDDLTQNKRPKIDLDEGLIIEIIQKWQMALIDSKFEKDLIQIFCILEHSKKALPVFDHLYMETFNKVQDSEILIYAMGSFHKQVLDRLIKEGSPLPKPLLYSLEQLIEHKSPEVFEWSLRTIERLGNQGLQFRELILKNRPSVGALFNKHKRSCLLIIKLLEERWRPFL